MVRYHSLKGFYEVEKTIGCGGFAKVKLATHIATGEKVAIKIMDKVLLGADSARIKLELNALQTLSHENICKLYQVIETDTHFFIVMEYCSGGELFDHIVEKNRLTESESRMFFRQIVSAVAYLHSLGYAHRDLKPENILLDKYQNLKLIDFGLCAKPEGGIESPLFTSCGSPTYAAPELVSGKQYFGTEVDVWAMGVLLYALLAGALPFDDLNIDCLYKKILAGKYEEPSFISQESLHLIRSMLQVNPKKRITIADLLSHPWLTLGILDPVDIDSKNYECYDEACIKVMAAHYQVNTETMWNHLEKWTYDYYTATYLLLLTRKRRGSILRLNSGSSKLAVDCNMEKVPIKSGIPYLSIDLPNSNKIKTLHQTRTPNTRRSHRVRTPETSRAKQFSSPASGFTEPTMPSSLRKPLKRFRSPAPDDSSPVPAKKITIQPSTPTNTPQGKRNADNSDTPGSARRVLGSIERSFHKVMNVLTPKKFEEGVPPGKQPVLLASKELCNVSTTQCRDPEFVITELSKALDKKGIHCKRKGYTLRGKLLPNTEQRLGECSFELEICYIPNMGPPQSIPKNVDTPTKSILKKGPLSFNTPTQKNDNASGRAPAGDDIITESRKLIPTFVGVRRKRLKGDSWRYKKVCEEVLALTATDLKGIIESSV